MILEANNGRGETGKVAEGMVKHRWRRAWLLGGLLLGIQPCSLFADWRVLAEADQSGALTRRLATVDSDKGERLAIFKDAEQRVYGTFRLREGLQVLVADQCPTFRVDKRRPLALSGADQQNCLSTAGEVTFHLGTVKEGRIASPVLLQLMNGNTASFRYRLEHVGYAEAAFDWQRSKQALAEVIGPDVEVEWR